MPTIEAIVSDADGTLVDSVSLIRRGQYETAKEFLENHGIPTETIPSYEGYEILLNQQVGGSARQTLERTVRVLYEDQPYHLDGMNFDELHRLLDPIQDRIAPEQVRAFPCLAETLKWIGEAGIKLAIFTSGTPHHVVRNFGLALPTELGEDIAHSYLDKNIPDDVKLNVFIDRMSNVFDLPGFTVITCDDVGQRTKPDPLSIQMAMRRMGVKPENTLVLGDHAYDMQAGSNAYVFQKVGITHGFDDRETLQRAGATAVIDSLCSLPLLIPTK